MEDYKISKYIKEYAVNGVLPMEKQLELFEQYHNDLANGISPAESLAYATLIIANDGLIYKYAKQIVKGKVDFTLDSEIYSAGKLGLINAVNKFDTTKNSSFANFAFYCVNAEICRYLNEINKDKKEVVSIFDFIKIKNGDQYFDLDIPSDEYIAEEVAEKIDFDTERRILFSCFKYFTEAEQKSMIYYYGLLGHKPLTLMKIAERLSVSRPRVDGLLKRAMHKIHLLTTNEDLTPEEQHTLKMYTRKEHDLLPPIQKFLEQDTNYTVEK